MIKEQNLFLNSIKDYINLAKTEIKNDVNWDILFNYGQSHQLTAILYHQCKGDLPAKYEACYKNAFLNTLSISINRKRATNR